MRIDPKPAILPTSLDAPKSQATAKAPAPASGGSVVALSSAASAVAPDAPSPSVTARLDRIRALLDHGEYPVDLDLLASRIVDDELMRSSGKVS